MLTSVTCLLECTYVCLYPCRENIKSSYKKYNKHLLGIFCGKLDDTAADNNTDDISLPPTELHGHIQNESTDESFIEQQQEDDDEDDDTG